DDVTDPALLALGASRDAIPTATLRGVIGIAESYLPVRSFAAALAHGASVAEAADGVVDLATDALIDAALQRRPTGPKRVAVIGASTSLAALLRELALFVPGVDVSLFVSSRDATLHGHPDNDLARRLAELRVGIDSDDPLPGRAGRVMSLPSGGTLRVFSHDAPDLAAFAAEQLRALPAVEAAVFLSEPGGDDRDARTAMRVLRFLRRLEDNSVPRGARLHLVAELLSVEKGQYLQQHVDVRRHGFENDGDLRLTLIAKQTIKDYFMVHAAFVPGVSAIYDELLEERGQDVVRLPVSSSSSSSLVTWAALSRRLQAKKAVAIGYERMDGAVVLAPAPTTTLRLDELAGIYAVAESAQV
ncbi:MAG TPA: hypothetical protein VGF99_05875, partial [Myxococcota bacterium]